MLTLPRAGRVRHASTRIRNRCLKYWASAKACEKSFIFVLDRCQNAISPDFWDERNEICFECLIAVQRKLLEPWDATISPYRVCGASTRNINE